MNAKFLGNIGEKKVKDEIAKLKKGKKLNNITIRYAKNKTTQIDHILITKHKIFVFETKHYSGKIKVKPNKNVWKQKTKSGKEYQLFNPITQNNFHIMILSLILRIPQDYFVNVVVFSGSAEIKKKKSKKLKSAEFVVHTEELIKLIKKENKLGSYKLYPKKIKSLLDKYTLPASKKTDKEHIKNLSS